RRWATGAEGRELKAYIRAITAGIKWALIRSIAISSQQMNSVAVDSWFSLPMKLPKPPKKSRSTKTGLFGRLDFTSKVSSVRNPLLKIGPVVRLEYLTSP